MTRGPTVSGLNGHAVRQVLRASPLLLLSKHDTLSCNPAQRLDQFSRTWQAVFCREMVGVT